jgi:hypothetical protein
MAAIARLNLVLKMKRKMMMMREAAKESEDKLRENSKLDRVLLTRLSWISLWLSALI